MNIRIIIVFLLVVQFISAKPDICFSQNKAVKTRLTGKINDYQPSLLPVTSLDGQKIYFDRKRHPENLGSLHDEDDIWMSAKSEFGAWADPVNLKLFNTSGSNALFTLLPDGKTALVYNEYLDESDVITRSYGILDLEKAVLTPLTIKNYKNTSKNFFGYLSHDQKYLFLSLENENSIGGLDIFLSVKESESVYSEPVNLSKLNSKGTEVGFFLAFDNRTLYFATDRGYDNANLDLCMSRRIGDNWENWTEPVSLGPEINSVFDETSIWITALADSAFIASGDTVTGRTGIYSIIMPDKLKPGPYTILSGSVTSPSKSFISGSIIIENNDNVRIVDYSNGEYTFALSDPAEYKISFTASGHKDHVINLNTKNQNITWKTQNIILEPKEEPVEESIELFFNTAEFLLSPKNKEQLSELYKQWNFQNIIIEGHADPRGDELYNFELSVKRADSAKEYLVKLGIPENKIETIPRGESEAVPGDYQLSRKVKIHLTSNAQVEIAN